MSVNWNDDLVIPLHKPARRTSWNAAELMALTFPEPKWAVPGLIAEGMTLLAGAPKIGKSWIAWNLAVAVATGGKALGSLPVEGGDVLYMALEDTPRRLQSRLTKVLAGSPAPERLTVTTECETLLAGGIERIREWLSAHPSARLVIVDVFARVRGRAGTSSQNAYEADYIPASMLKEIADEFEVAVIVIHHTRKAGSEDFLDTVSGTQGLAGAADSIVVITRPRGAADGLLSITGRDVEEAEHAMSFDPERGLWTLLDGPAVEHTVAETRQLIMRHLREHGPSTPKNIAEALDLNHENAKKTCARMAAASQIDTDGNGTYFPLPPVPVVPAVPDSLSHSPKGQEGQEGQVGTCESCQWPVASLGHAQECGNPENAA